VNETLRKGSGAITATTKWGLHSRANSMVGHRVQKVQINGLMVWRINISPIIITLGALTIYRGIALRMPLHRAAPWRSRAAGNSVGKGQI
jgi:ribose/xylose/arabinose/galactoside ABC-type transport system permease subunit